MRNFCVCIISIALLSGCATKNEWEILSPGKKIKITLALDPLAGTLSYQAGIQNGGDYQTALNPSPLGIVTSNAGLSKDLEFSSSSTVKSIDEPFEMFSGRQKSYENKANELAIDFVNPEGQILTIRIRAYDDGVAFRYEIPGEGQVTITSESTGFSIPLSGKAWLPNYDKAQPWAPAYETPYTNGSPVGENAPEGPGWSFPMLFTANESWLLISDANVFDYAGVHLDSVVEGGTYRVRFPEPDERYSEGPSLPTVKLSMHTPWRFVIIGDDLNTIVKSGMVFRLADPSKIDNTSWIKPGRASWSWWSGAERSMAAFNKFTDMSAEMGWEYTLIDAGWQNIEGGTLEDVVQYADSKGVGTLLWYNSGGRRGRGSDADTPHEPTIMEDPEKRRAEFKRISEMGVKGIKVDFFNSDKQHVMDQYRDILEDAVDFKLLVNFHGCTLPRGWTRTYPHLLTMEAVKGGENYRYDDNFTDAAPWLNTIYFLSRNTVGPMDYTPVIFSDSQHPHSTTFCHELATVVLFESGITHFADTPDAYLTKGDQVRTFLSNVPVVWEELQLLDAYPGKYAVVARKSFNGSWYVAGINGEEHNRQTSLNLDFLEEGKSYSALTFVDKEPRKISSRVLDSVGGTIDITMMPKGGFVYVISEK